MITYLYFTFYRMVLFIQYSTNLAPQCERSLPFSFRVATSLSFFLAKNPPPPLASRETPIHNQQRSSLIRVFAENEIGCVITLLLNLPCALVCD